MKSDSTRLAKAASAALLLLLAPTAFAQVFSAGHADLGLGEGSTLEPHLHLAAGAIVDGSPLTEEAEFEPDALYILVPDSTFAFVESVGGRPAGALWAPIGVPAGTAFWFLPEGNSGPGGAGALGAPFFGIGGEDIDLGAFDGNDLTLTLVDATLPASGQFSLYAGGFAPTFFMSTANGISSADAVSLDLGLSDHIHLNWAFTQPGLYDLTFRVSALQGGIPISADATYTFAVSAIPEPGYLALLAGLLALGAAYWHRRHR